MKSAVKAFVQARMSSKRFPGKVLAPFRGEAVIRHVLRAVELACPIQDMVLLTSQATSDDPLAAYADTLGVQVYRGELENVLRRFASCVAYHPCEWILRINGDSPLLFPGLITLMKCYSTRTEVDLVTTIFPRSFPRGQNVELISVRALRMVAEAATTPDDQEHVTPFFYRHPDRFRIVNVESGDRALAEVGLAVDTLDDLHRLERLTSDELHRLRPPVLAAETIASAQLSAATQQRTTSI